MKNQKNDVDFNNINSANIFSTNFARYNIFIKVVMGLYKNN